MDFIPDKNFNKAKEIPILQRRKGEISLSQEKIEKMIHKRKVAYKDKIENHFITNDLKSVWKGIKIMSGYGKVNETDKSPLQNLTTEYANELNLFYNRFDKYDFSTEICELESMFKNSGGLDIVVSEEDVRRKFGRLNSSKAAGPDKISAQVLRSCSSQLANIYSIIFNMCFSSCIIPNLWKQSCIVPIPKKSCISSMNDLRPVALTPIAMKVCEEFFLQHLKPLVNSFLDPLQFAYQPSRGCDDAILFTLEKLYSHLEKSHCGHSARVDKKSLIGYNNHQSVEILRNTSRVVNLSFARYLRGVKYEQLQKATATSEPEPPTESTIMAQVHGPGPGPGLDPESDLNDNAESEALEFAGPLDLLTENHLKQTWSEILGPDYKIVVAQITKFHKKGGLGISLEGTVDVEDGEEVRPHHYIRSILDDGPVGINSELMSGDELLEVNGIKLLGLNHVDVVAILKELPMHVRMVCARSTEVPVSSEYGYDLQKLMPMTDRLVKAKSDGSLAAVPSNVLETSFSRMKSRSLEPLTGLATWSTEPQIIELTKGDKGLGFSILDYQDPLNPKETVIVIRSLVPGGVAQQDGQLKPGDRLMSVNDMNLESASLETAVQALKGAPKGVVRIAVAKPLPFPDGASNADSHQMGRMDLHLPIMPDKVTVTKSTPPQNDGISIDSNNDEKANIELLEKYLSLHASPADSFEM
ncbi:Patj [Nymphon striatum]|nr:Patj [Nymphon striatum]